jgi:hypothetical protein
MNLTNEEKQIKKKLLAFVLLIRYYVREKHYKSNPNLT